MSLFLHRAGLVQPDPAVYSFTMTAADAGGFFQGYSNGSVFSPFGSIDVEPISGETLDLLTSGAANAIQFAGDITATVAGLKVWVDGVEYPFDASDWTYDSGDNTTVALWDSLGPIFVNAVTYFIEIK